MKVKNTAFITFDLKKCQAFINLTPRQRVLIDKDTLFAHRSGNGYTGYAIINGGTYYSPSSKVMRQVAKYLVLKKEDLKLDYYRMPFEKLEF